MQVMYETWQSELSKGFKTSAELLQYLNLPIISSSTAAEAEFKTRVPRGFANRMRKGDLQDPLLKQVLAVPDELIPQAGFTRDPLKETEYNPLPGLIHKYHGRVLITLTRACAINCRYCFRRHFPYEENNPGREGLMEICEYIRKEPSIHEVILSGGDPLLAPNQTLRYFFDLLRNIKHVQTIRIHSRIPIVLPARIDESFLHLLRDKRFKFVLVLHANHPNEFDEAVAAACKRLRHTGVTLLNQTVLLKTINDSVEILSALSHTLWQHGILPYYLHLLDKVTGAAHFDVSKTHASDLSRTLAHVLPGYLVPRLVADMPGEKSKQAVF